MDANQPQTPWLFTTPEIAVSDTGNKSTSVEFRSGDSIEFTVYHEPMGAPRMTQRDKWKGRPVIERYHAFRDAIRRDSPVLPQADQIESLSWVAYFVPKKAKRATMIGKLHRDKPDRDNIDKALLDALFEEDSAIASGTITKRWGIEARIVVTIIVA